MAYYGSIEPINSRTQEIPRQMWDPHYTDQRFTRTLGGKTIYLAPGLVTVQQFGAEVVEGAHYNFSDRISESYGHEEVGEAWRAAKEQAGNRITAEFFETWLQHVYADPTTTLQHIIAGVSQGSGYSYRVFGTVSGARQ